MASFDPKKFTTNDWGVVGGGLLGFIGLFFHAYSVKVKGTDVFGGASFGGSLSGWHFKGLWFGVILLLVAAAFVFVKVQGIADTPKLPVGPKLAVLAVTAVALLIILIRVFTYPSANVPGVSAGASFGSYLVLIAAIVSVVFAALDFRSSGEKLPDFKGGSGAPPAA